MQRIRVFSCFPMYFWARLGNLFGVNASGSHDFLLSDVFEGETSGPGGSKCIVFVCFLAFRCISGEISGAVETKVLGMKKGLGKSRGLKCMNYAVCPFSSRAFFTFSVRSGRILVRSPTIP